MMNNSFYQKLKSPSLLSIAAVFAFASLLALLPVKPADASSYNGARIIDNSIFLKSNTMTRNQIQNFLSSKGSGLATRSYNLNCYGPNSTERQWYTAIGAPCDTTVPASDIIYYAAQIYGMNPQVILATLQKEQSLITTANPTSWQISQAMGYGCPTSGSCSSESNFFYQIDSGTWVLRYHYERANGNMTWWHNSTSWTCGTEKNFYKPNLYPNQNVRFYDQNDVHYRTYRLANAATSSMYCYTPHAYNNPQGLYGRAPYGTTGMYYSGSYNFVTFFNTWFGSTHEPTTGVVHRLFNQNANNHLYTTSQNEREKAVREANFKYEGVAFRTCPSGGREIYRLFNPVTGRHLFTASSNERDKANRETNFSYEGIAFRVCGSKQVYRLYSAPAQKHFYTTSLNERNNLTKNTSFVYEGIAFEVN